MRKQLSNTNITSIKLFLAVIFLILFVCYLTFFKVFSCGGAGEKGYTPHPLYLLILFSVFYYLSSAGYDKVEIDRS